MKQEMQKDEILTRYLLGDLPDKERLRVEERYFQDDSYFEELLAIEDELMYEYRQGNLTERERKLFEKHLLATSQDKQKAKFADTFLKTIDDFAPLKEQKEKSVSVPFWKSFLSRFSFQNPALRFAALALLLLFLAGGVWLFIKNKQLQTEIAALQKQHDEQQRLRREIEEKQKEKERLESELAKEKEQSEQNQEQIKKLEEERAELEKEIEAARSVDKKPRNSTSIFAVLLPGLSRSGSQQTKTITITENTNILRLQLKLKRVEAYKNYKVSISNVDGGGVFNVSNLKLADKSVAIQIPVRNLKNGDYQITLQGITANGGAEEIDDYYFRVVKRL